MNLLITGAWGQAKNYISSLQQMGHTVMFLQQEKDPLPCSDDWVEGIICNAFFLFHPIETLTNLRFIQLTSAGFDRAPMEYVQGHGIKIYNAKDVYSIPMAEHAVACALWFYRSLGTFRKNQQAHIWEKQRNLKELNGRTVLIIGCGNVGKACAKAFNALGCKVIGIDKQIQQAECISQISTPDALPICLKKADIIILTVCLTEETRNLISAQEFSFIKDSALLINLSRGEVIHTESLLKHIPRLAGIALDVFEEEPLTEDNPLWTFDNVLITPHNSFVGDGNAERLYQIIIRNLSNP